MTNDRNLPSETGAIEPPIAVEDGKRGRGKDEARETGARSRSAIVFAMAAVAIGTAIVAYFAARAATGAIEARSSALRQLVERDRIEQHINIVIAADARLLTIYDEHSATAQLLKKRAEGARATSPGAAHAADLEAQSHLDALDALSVLFQGAIPSLVGGVQTLDPDAEKALLELQDPSLPLLDPEGQSAIAIQDGDRAIELVGAIVGMIVGLVLLTAAVVFRRASRVTATAGAAVAIGATAFVAGRDTMASLEVFAVYAVALLLYAVYLGLQQRLPDLWPRFADWFDEEETRGTAEASVHGAWRARGIPERAPIEPGLLDVDGLGGQTAKRIAFSIALITLLAASIGYKQAEAFRDAEEQLHAAQEHGMRALADQLAGEQQAQTELFSYIQYVDASMAVVGVRQRLAYWTSVGDADRAVATQRELEDLNAVADRASARSTIHPGDPAGPVMYTDGGAIGDPSYPNRRAVEAIRPTLEEFGLQDAAAHAATDAALHGRLYTLGLAILAIALYLLGLSLVLRTPMLRWTFAALSLALVCASIVIAVPAAWSPSPDQEKARAAAAAYADGMALRLTATTKDDNHKAAEELSEAVRLRDDFGLADVALAQAVLAETSPQEVGILSVDEPTERDAALGYLGRALNASDDSTGVDTAEVRADRAFLTYRKAIDGTSIDRRLLQESIESTRLALDTKPRTIWLEAIANANLGVAELAWGDREAAWAAYEESVARIRFIDGSTDPRPEAQRELIVAGALTDLDNLATRHTELQTDVAGIKAELIGAVWPSAQNAAVVPMADLSLLPLPAVLQWTAVVQGGEDLLRHDVVVQWYQRPTGTKDWFVLPDVSGPGTGPEAIAPVSPDNGKPGGFFGQALMTASRVTHCWPAADYRLELYIDGRSVPSVATTVKEPILQAVVAHDVGLAFCRPRDWKRAPDTVPGLVTHYVEAGATTPTGIAVFRRYWPDPDGGARLRVAAAIDAVIKSDSGPGKPLPATLGTGHTVAGPFLARADSICEDHPFGDDGTARICGAAREGGSIVIMMVYGPSNRFAVTGQDLLSVVGSAVPSN